MPTRPEQAWFVAPHGIVRDRWAAAFADLPSGNALWTVFAMPTDLSFIADATGSVRLPFVSSFDQASEATEDERAEAMAVFEAEGGIPRWEEDFVSDPGPLRWEVWVNSLLHSSPLTAGELVRRLSIDRLLVAHDHGLSPFKQMNELKLDSRNGIGALDDNALRALMRRDAEMRVDVRGQSRRRGLK